MAASVKLATDFGTTDRLAVLRLQLMASEMASRIGTRIRERREELGLNQRQLADRIPTDAVSGQRVSDWERGVNKPSDRYMQLIATALEREVGWFYTEGESAETPNLLGVLDDESQLDRVEQKIDEVLSRLAALERLPDLLADLQEGVAQARREDAAHDMEVLRRIEEALRAQRRRPQPGQQ